MTQPDGLAMEAAAKLPKNIRVLIADDHRLFAQALEAILATDKRIDVVGQARDPREAAELAGELEPDVIPMDIAMPALDRFQPARQLPRRGATARVLLRTGANAR